jgi:hypothetical protein
MYTMKHNIIKIPNISPASAFTKHKIVKLCHTDDIVVFDCVYIHIYIIFYLKHNGMSSFNIILSSQSHTVNQYKKIRNKILKYCVTIYFNRQFLENNLIPKYAKIKIPNTSPASTFTKHKVAKLWLKYETFLYSILYVYILFCYFTPNTAQCPILKSFVIRLKGKKRRWLAQKYHLRFTDYPKLTMNRLMDFYYTPKAEFIKHSVKYIYRQCDTGAPLFMCPSECNLNLIS